MCEAMDPSSSDTAKLESAVPEAAGSTLVNAGKRMVPRTWGRRERW